MKNLFTGIIVLIMLPVSLNANSIVLNENFENGLPTSAPASETSVTLSSGTWVINGAFGKSDNGSMRLAMNTNGYIITPALDKPITISFNHRGSGSGKVLTVQKSVNGADWVTIGTATVNSASVYGSATISIGEGGNKNVRLKLLCGSATIYVDNIVIEVSDMPEEPIIQCSLTPIITTGSTVNLKITAGDGTGRTVIYRKSTDTNWFPEDGQTYIFGSWVDEEHRVAFSGNDSLITVTGLEAGESYFFAAFEYNGENENRNYKNSLPGKLQITTLEEPTISIYPVNINFGAIKVGNSEKREFTVSAKFLTAESGNITIQGSDTFKVSTDISGTFSNQLILPFTSNTLGHTKIYIQFLPSNYRTYIEKISISVEGAAEQQITVSGTGSNTDAKVYYISPNGNDNNTGSFDSPLKNLQVAVNKMLPGDTIFVRGGIYYPSYKQDGSKTTIRLNNSGTSTKKLCIFNYPGESPVLNFRDQPKAVSVRGIQLNGSYWHIKGIHITEAGDNGMKIEGNNNIIEKCSFSYNDDTGLQLGFGHNFSDTYPNLSSNDGTYCCNNTIIDCDSYFNYDTDNRGSDADGFACKMHNGKNNRFIRCRAWDNSDDAWDLFETDYPVYLIECWGWGSGRESNFPVTGGSFQGNGNGIKLGGNGTGGSSKGKHEAWYCIAFNNNRTGSVKGFDQNSHGGGIKLVNCLAFGNGYDYMFETASGEREFFNNVCFGNIEIASGATQGNNASLTNPTKGWTNNVCSTFSVSDFNSLNETDAKKPRGADGSMPLTFARLKKSSPLLNIGTIVTNNNNEINDLGLPFTYYGAAPDLGPYEFFEETPSTQQIIINKQAKPLLNVFPNPLKKFGTLAFSITHDSEISISLYNFNGIKIKDIHKQKAFSLIEYYIPIDVSGLVPGAYIFVLENSKETIRHKVVIK